MDRKAKRKRLVLEVLLAAEQPLTSIEIADELSAKGLDISERTIRVYLQQLAADGMTRRLGRRGHELLEQGRLELEASSVLERVGFLSTRIDQMTYRMSFDLASRSGSVVVNTSMVPIDQLLECSNAICGVFEKGYAMGELVGLLPPGAQIGTLSTPAEHAGFCSVCSITLNGVLLKHGVPVRSRFGGLLELRNGTAQRFVELITYDGTSIDPLEVFIRSGMTNYLGAIHDGNGRIGASFRELPADSRRLALGLDEKLGRIGLGGFMTIGRSGQVLMDITVNEGHAGAIVIGGLNPISVLEESGYRVMSRAMSGLLDYNELFHYSELPERLKDLT